MRAPSLKKYFTGFENVIRTLLIASLFLFFATYYVFEDMAKLNYLMYGPAAAMGVLCITYYIKKREIPEVRPLIPVYVFVLIAYFTSLIANPLAALTYRTLIVLAAFASVIYLSCRIIGNTKTVFRVLFITSLFLPVAFTCYYFQSIIKLDFSTRLGAFFGNQNGIAAKLSVSAILLTSVAVYKRQYWVLLFVLFDFVLIISTGSKMGLMYLAGISVFGICAFFRKRIWLGILVSIFAILIMAVTILVFPPFVTIKERLFEHIGYLLGQGNVSASSYQRGLYRDNAFYLSFKNLFIGYGVDGFDVVSGIGTYSHNNISELICDFGLFGLLSFYGIFVYIALTFKNVRKTIDATIAFYVLLGITVLTSTATIFYYDKIVFFLFAICIFINTQKNVEYTRITI